MSRLEKLATKTKSVLPKVGSTLAVGAVLSVAMVEPSFAGGDDAAAVARRVQTQVTDFKRLAVAIAFLLGIVLFIAGLWMLYKDSKQPGQGHAKNGLIAMLVGAGLLVVQSLVGVTAQSVTGNSATATGAVTATNGF